METHLIEHPPARNQHHQARSRQWMALVVLVALVALVALAGCGQTTQPNGVNFGDQKNHIHAMLALPDTPGGLLVATHRGLFRTTDGGKSWKEVMGGPGQPAENLMTQYLTVSPRNPQRIYVEAITFPDLPKTSGTPGIYTSTDGGATWMLATPLTALPSPGVYYMTAGAGDERQLYIYLQALQRQGLYATKDAGATWQPVGTLPDSQDISLGLLADPANAGHLFTYSAGGLFASQDDGAHWQTAEGIKDGISKALLVGSMLYASGDDGTFVSQDSGAHFTLTVPNMTFQYLASDPAHPMTAFGLSGAGLNGSAFFITTDGGATWKPESIPPNHLLAPGLVVDPHTGTTLYLGNSYPVMIYSTADSGQHWSQIAP